jgi:MYXO-CTERM domain-containing protein
VGLHGLRGQKIVLNAAPVPEPAGVALALMALLGLGAVARSRKSH